MTMIGNNEFQEKRMLKEMIEMKLKSLQKESDSMYPYAKRSKSLSRADMDRNKEKLDKMHQLLIVIYLFIHNIKKII